MPIRVVVSGTGKMGRQVLAAVSAEAAPAARLVAAPVAPPSGAAPAILCLPLPARPGGAGKT